MFFTFMLAMLTAPVFAATVGITGNSHMLMMDKNNGAIADVIDTWLAGKGLTD